MRYTVYKVLEETDSGKLISAGAIPKEMKIVYKRKQKNVGKFKNSKVFVFKNLSDAEKFRSGLDAPWSCRIFKGKCRTLEKVNNVPNVWNFKSHFSDIKEEIEPFWKYGPTRLGLLNFHNCADGVYKAGYFYLENEV